jgi:hypothetical protein
MAKAAPNEATAMMVTPRLTDGNDTMVFLAG